VVAVSYIDSIKAESSHNTDKTEVKRDLD